MQTWDGTELFYRNWLPERPAAKALLLFHRGHEHSGRWQRVVESLGLHDVAIFAWDARGHGRSPGARGAAESIGHIIKDVDAFARHIREHYEIAAQDTIVLAHSLAAVTVGAWVHDYAPPIRAMILATSAFEVKLYVPFAMAALRARQKLFGSGYVKSFVKGRMLTHDQEEAARYQADPLIFRQIAVNVLLDLHDTAQRLMADAGAIQTPTLMLGAGKDWVVTLKAQQKFFAGLSSPIKEMQVFENARHAIFHEQEKAEVVRRVREFILQRFSEVPAVASLLDADKSGHTWREYERLRNGNGGDAKFAVARAGLRAAGRLSDGVKIGWRSGFDSGISLDYVYQNESRGAFGIGRLIDRSYLNSIGWRGIRQRKTNLERALRSVMQRLKAEGRPVHILDVASGAGRYVMEAMAALPEVKASALLRDYKQENVEAAGRLAEDFGLNQVSVEQGDAFARESFAAVSPRPTVAIVSGLYELFPSNDMILQSLGGVADAIDPGGTLIYTNQPWHPQVEFIARVLRNREGEPWIMRRRTTAEMDQLVQAAGFEKLSMDVDQWGMFTVSVARRIR